MLSGFILTKKNKMKTQIVTIMLGIFLIGIVSSIYAGVPYNEDFGHEILNCSIIGNSSDLEGLEWNWSGSVATISTVINYKPDNFTLSCWVNQSYEEIEVNSGSHSHHSHNDVINTIKNTTNQSQQENNSNIEGSSSLADNNLPPILNISNDSDYNPSSNELNKQTKEFFKQISDFFKSYWIGISIILLSILLILVSYKVFSKEEPQVEIEMPKYITDKPIEFPQ
jgi:transcription elongation factor Elf1